MASFLYSLNFWGKMLDIILETCTEVNHFPNSFSEYLCKKFKEQLS